MGKSTTPTLQGAIAEIQEVIRAVTGIRKAPNEPPESLNGVFPFVATYSQSGRLLIGEPSQTITTLADIIIELHLAREKGNLERVIQQSIDYVWHIPNALGNELYSGMVTGGFEHIQTWGDMDYEYGALGYDKLNTFGFRFTLRNVKLQRVIDSTSTD